MDEENEKIPGPEGETKGSGNANQNNNPPKESEKLDELSLKISEKEKEIQGLVDILQRTQADFQNYIKNAEKEKQKIRETSPDDLILSVIEISENLEAALKTIKNTGENRRTVDGITAVLRQIQKILLEKGARRIPSVGAPFDMSRHEAVEAVESKEKPENTIVEEIQSGYTINGRLLRPAKVIVTKKQEVSGNV